MNHNLIARKLSNMQHNATTLQQENPTIDWSYSNDSIYLLLHVVIADVFQQLNACYVLAPNMKNNRKLYFPKCQIAHVSLLFFFMRVMLKVFSLI